MVYNNNSVGQITIRRLGEKYCVCIGGTPQQIYTMIDDANKMVIKLRKKYGRRITVKSKRKTVKRKRKKKKT